MTVADDLATLHYAVSFAWDNGLGHESKRKMDAALDRVEAEIARLERERDAAQARFDTYEPGTMEGQVRAIWELAEHYGHPPISSKHPVGFLQRYIEAAEAEVERLQRHPDAWSQEAFDQQKARAEAAEEVARAARPFAEPHDTTFAQYEALRAALARLDGPG